jgi:hypothetical protein
MAKLPEPDPTVEIGNANPGIAPWSSFCDAAEDTAELRFPESVKVYDRMRNDDQLSGCCSHSSCPSSATAGTSSPTELATRRSSM